MIQRSRIALFFTARKASALACTLVFALMCAHTSPPTHAQEKSSAEPIRIERFTRPGPIAGVVTKIDLTHPRIAVELALSPAPDIVLKPSSASSGRTIDASCVANLKTPSDFARQHNFDVTINASFFSAPSTRDVGGKKIRYFAGNCSAPVGFHVSEYAKMTEPQNDRLRATIVMHTDGKASIIADAQTLPMTTRWAVSGNAMVLNQGAIVSTAKDGTRHPRSVAGLSADRKTLILVALDGRAPSHSIGANMVELGEVMLSLGAHDAINLDGGGSTAMILRDAETGVFAVANRPSEVVAGTSVPAERPVVDVIGVKLLPEKSSKAQ